MKKIILITGIFCSLSNLATAQESKPPAATSQAKEAKGKPHMPRVEEVLVVKEKKSDWLDMKVGGKEQKK